MHSSPHPPTVNHMEVGSQVHASELVMPWPVYAMAWTNGMRNRPGLLALGSFSIPNATGSTSVDNKLSVVEHDQNGDCAKIGSVAEAPHPYPISKIQWAPVSSSNPDLIATTGDYLRIWRLCTSPDSLAIESVLANQSKTDLVAPLTSFDWNETSPNLIVTSSVDTTCTLWDVSTSQAKTQLIAHDREVFDVGFASGTADIFASVGADGSVRLFDLRALEHSTIIYEHPHSAPLLRVAWNRQDPNYMAVLAYESHSIDILDIRLPSVAVAELAGHTTCVNAVAWHPNNSGYLVSGGDDGRVLVWDVGMPVSKPVPSNHQHKGSAGSGGRRNTISGVEPAAVYAPILAHAPHPAGLEVENLSISYLADWVAVTAASQVKLLHL